MPVNDGAVEQIRTAYLILTKDVLYLLSYNSICPFALFTLYYTQIRVSTYFNYSVFEAFHRLLPKMSASFRFDL